MTISSSASRISYVGDGTTTAFAFPYEFGAGSDLKVYKAGVLQTITTHYTVSGGSGSSGTVTFVTAPAAAQSVVIYDDPPATQLLDYIANDPFPAESHESGLDKLTRLVRRLINRIDRAVRLSDSDVSGASTILPTPSAQKVIGWDAAGTAMVNYSASDLTTVAAFAAWQAQVFSGDGVTTAFVLSSDPGNVANLDVAIGGVTQYPTTDFTLSGTTLTFLVAPPSGTDNILARWGQALPQSVTNANAVNFTPAGTGAVVRTVESALRERISVSDFGVTMDGVTDDAAAATLAVASAIARGADLYWPMGVAKTTSSIANFHSVKHYGPGQILRGSDTFYIEPTASETNRVYINVGTGSDANDGLSASQPKQTLQGGIDYFQNWAHALIDGTWKLKLAAGTYASAAFPNNSNTSGLISRNPLYIEGPEVGGHPNVPTAIIKEGATQAGTGLNCSFTNVYLKDIKVEDYNGSTSSSGVLGGQGANLFTENVHIEDSYYGVTMGSRGQLDMKGGIINDCGQLNSTTIVGSGGAGIRMLFFIQSAIGNQGASDRTEGPFITNCVNGILAQEHITGHVDWCLFEDNGNAIYCLLNSRLNTNSSEFNRNSVVARIDNGSNVDLSDTGNAYGTGADANLRLLHIGVGCLGAHTAVLDGVNFALGSQEIRFSADYPDTAINSTSSGSTIEDHTINGGWLTGTVSSSRPAAKIRAVVSGSFSGTNGAKNLAIRLGSGGPTAQVNFAAAATGPFHVEMSADFEATAKQLLRAVGWCDDNNTQVGITEATIDMTTDQPITAHAWVGNAADSITIRSIEWYIVGT